MLGSGFATPLWADLPRITIPEKEQAAPLLQLGWTLPEQPPPRIRSLKLPDHN